MNDSETRDVLIALCEAVKVEYRYLYALNASLTRLFQALKQDFPEIEDRYKQQGILIQEFPEAREQIEQVDALLEKLRKE